VVKKISGKPVKAILDSHHHTDHYNGASAIVDPADVASGKVEIYAWQNFAAEMTNEFGELIQRQSMGSGYYGGAFLSPQDTTLTIAGIEIRAF